MTKDKLIAWLEKEIPDINDTFPKCIAYKIALETLKNNKKGLRVCKEVFNLDNVEYMGDFASIEYKRVETDLDSILKELE